MRIAMGMVCVLLMVSSVSAAILNVDCGPGDSLCSETELQDEFDYVEKRNEIQEVAIVLNYRVDFAQQKMIDETKDIISKNSAKWSIDQVGGGTSFKNVKRYLLGSMYYELEDIENYFDVLRIFFVPRQEYDELQHRLDIQEAKFMALEKHLKVEVKYSNALECSARLIEAKRINESVSWGDGWVAVPGEISCIRAK